MIQLMPPPELITGITNLINFFIALIIFFYIVKLKFKNILKKTLWSIMVFLVAVVGLLGAYLHAVILSDTIYYTGWMILELIMGLMVSSLTINTFYEKYGNTFFKKILTTNIIVCILYILAIIFIAPLLTNSFYVFAIFAAKNLIIDFIVFASMIKEKNYTKWYIAALTTMIIGSIIQALRFNFFIYVEIDSNSVYHIALSIALVLLAIAYTKSEKEQLQNKAL